MSKRAVLQQSVFWVMYDGVPSLGFFDRDFFTGVNIYLCSGSAVNGQDQAIVVRQLLSKLNCYVDNTARIADADYRVPVAELIAGLKQLQIQTIAHLSHEIMMLSSWVVGKLQDRCKTLAAEPVVQATIEKSADNKALMCELLVLKGIVMQIQRQVQLPSVGGEEPVMLKVVDDLDGSDDLSDGLDDDDDLSDILPPGSAVKPSVATKSAVPTKRRPLTSAEKVQEKLIGAGCLLDSTSRSVSGILMVGITGQPQLDELKVTFERLEADLCEAESELRRQGSSSAGLSPLLRGCSRRLSQLREGVKLQLGLLGRLGIQFGANSSAGSGGDSLSPASCDQPPAFKRR